MLVFASDVCSLVLGHFALFGSVLTHPNSKSYTIAFFFFLVPYSMRNVLTKFEIFLNWLNRLENRIGQFIRFFPGIAVRALCIVWVSSPSSRLETTQRCFFWVPYFAKNVLTKFEILQVIIVWKHFNFLTRMHAYILYVSSEIQKSPQH